AWGGRLNNNVSPGYDLQFNLANEECPLAALGKEHAHLAHGAVAAHFEDLADAVTRVPDQHPLGVGAVLARTGLASLDAGLAPALLGRGTAAAPVVHRRAGS